MGPDLYVAIGTIAAIALIGMVAKWLLENFLTEREASIASFALLLGNSLGAWLLDFNFDSTALLEKSGSLAGLAALWWLLFKRKRPATD